MKTESYSHCHGESSFHIVFSPKYRHDVFGKDEIKTFCEKCFNEVASKENFDIRALKVMEDHVHLFVSIPPKFSVSETVQYFKGYSARKIFLEFPWLKQFEIGEKRFWGRTFVVSWLFLPLCWKYNRSSSGILYQTQSGQKTKREILFNWK